MSLALAIPFVDKILDRMLPDKKQAEIAKLKLRTLEQNGELDRIDKELSAIIAEAQSKDPWTSRARPSFMYVMYAYILAGIPIGILSIFNPDAALQISIGAKAWMAAIPGELYALFGAGYLGYSHYRSADKKLIK